MYMWILHISENRKGFKLMIRGYIMSYKIFHTKSYSVLAFHCDCLIGFFLQIAALCLAHQLPRVAFLCSESMIEADRRLLEDPPVSCQEYLSVLRWIHHFTDNLYYISLKDLRSGQHIHGRGNEESCKTQLRMSITQASLSYQIFSWRRNSARLITFDYHLNLVAAVGASGPRSQIDLIVTEQEAVSDPPQDQCGL